MISSLPGSLCHPCRDRARGEDSRSLCRGKGGEPRAQQAVTGWRRPRWAFRGRKSNQNHLGNRVPGPWRRGVTLPLFCPVLVRQPWAGCTDFERLIIPTCHRRGSGRVLNALKSYALGKSPKSRAQDINMHNARVTSIQLISRGDKARQLLTGTTGRVSL